MPTGIEEALIGAAAKIIIDTVAKPLIDATGVESRVKTLLGLDPTQRAVKTALRDTVKDVGQKYPAWVDRWFDGNFLKNRAAPILARSLMSGKAPTAEELAGAWASYFPTAASAPYVEGATSVASDLLRSWDAHLRDQEALRPLFMARDTQMNSETANRILLALESLTVGIFDRLDRASPPLARHIKSFRTFCEEHTKGFVGRDFVFTAIDQRISQPDFPSGYVIIRGEPGIGKSALMAQLVKTQGYVHHFNMTLANVRTPAQFLANVCAQLITRYDLPYTDLVPQASSDSLFLVELLERACARESPVVVLVDALDEAEDPPVGVAVNRLFLPPDLPDGAYFVVTTREQHDYRLEVSRRAEDIVLTENDPSNRQDIERFILDFVQDHSDEMTVRLAAWTTDEAQFVMVMADRSEGNFMYLRYALPAMLNAAGMTRAGIGTLDDLPRGLEDYYRRHWRTMAAEDSQYFRRCQRPVICMLAVAREPVPAEKVTDWVNARRRQFGRIRLEDVRRVLAEWTPFLNQEGEPPDYWIYHTSFQQFLDRTQGLGQYRRAVAKAALDKIE